MTLIFVVPFLSFWTVSSLQLFLLKSVENGRDMYITPRTCTRIRWMKRMIGQTQHVLSHWRMFHRPISWSFVRSCRIILRHSLSLRSSRIRNQDKSQDSMRFHHTHGHLESCELCTSNSSYAIILATVYEQYGFFWSHEYFIASVRAPIVKRALLKHCKE